jgi:hypothetical protein
MEKRRLDNGLLLIAWLSNILAPLGIMLYFVMTYLRNPVDEQSLIFSGLILLFSCVSFLIFFRFRKVEFDDQYVYVKNVFNTETASFPVKNIRSVKKLMLTFDSKGRRRKGGKNYKITYLDNDGVEKKVRLMATTATADVNEFIKLTSFLGSDGFLPE